MMPLAMIQAGEQAKVVRVSGRPDMKKHLEDLGFVPDTTVSVIQSHSGNMIVKLRDSKLALTQEMARKIMVQ